MKFGLLQICLAYLAYVLELRNGEVKLKDIPIVREFPEELPWLPPEKEVEVPINMIPRIALLV